MGSPARQQGRRICDRVVSAAAEDRCGRLLCRLEEGVAVRKFDPKQMDRLLSPERKQWHDPEVILDGAGVRPGMVVADIGSGPGFLTIPLALRVGTDGKVLAVDVAPEMLERLRERAAEAEAGNVETLLSPDGGPLPIPAGSLDAAVMVNVLHEVDARDALLRDLLGALKAGGALGLVEWKKERSDFGPPEDHRLAERDVQSLLREAGFGEVEPFSVGAHHYGLRARKL